MFINLTNDVITHEWVNFFLSFYRGRKEQVFSTPWQIGHSHRLSRMFSDKIISLKDRSTPRHTRPRPTWAKYFLFKLTRNKTAHLEKWRTIPDMPPLNDAGSQRTDHDATVWSGSTRFLPFVWKRCSITVPPSTELWIFPFDQEYSHFDKTRGDNSTGVPMAC